MFLVDERMEREMREERNGMHGGMVCMHMYEGMAWCMWHKHAKRGGKYYIKKGQGEGPPSPSFPDGVLCWCVLMGVKVVVERGKKGETGYVSTHTQATVYPYTLPSSHTATVLSHLASLPPSAEEHAVRKLGEGGEVGRGLGVGQVAGGRCK